MTTSELLIRWTVRLALACYAAAVALRLLPAFTVRRQTAARGLWTSGCLLYLAHVVSAFQFVDGWSHEAAYRATAGRTAEAFGLDWGGGLYLNYLFTVVWVGDVLWWWRGLARYAARPRWLDRTVQALLAFMAFNGAVVFGSGPVRWVGLAVCLALGVLCCLRLWTGEPGGRTISFDEDKSLCESDPRGQRTTQSLPARHGPRGSTTMRRSVWLSIVGVVVYFAVTAVILFLCAGRWDLPFVWAYFGLWLVASVVGAVLADPGLARERIHPGPGGTDYLVLAVTLPLWFAAYAVAGLDVGRFHWSGTVPLAVQVLCLVVVGAGLAFVVWAVVVNRFFSSVIRIQRDRGHRVITTGPYRFVRHPGYAAAIPLLLCSGPALGSWVATIPMALSVPFLIRRTYLEDRILRDQLEGYAEYAQKVRYRLLPGVW
jgi:protein-S-isoprenylcysteine O-methyltransferase Ste14